MLLVQAEHTIRAEAGRAGTWPAEARKEVAESGAVICYGLENMSGDP